MKKQRYVKLGSLLEEFIIKKDFYVPLKSQEICHKFTAILTQKCSFLIPYIKDMKMDMKTLQLFVYMNPGVSSVVVAGFKEIITNNRLLELLNSDLEGIFLVKEILIQK